jgi:hypothetical protein
MAMYLHAAPHQNLLFVQILILCQYKEKLLDFPQWFHGPKYSSNIPVI